MENTTTERRLMQAETKRFQNQEKKESNRMSR
jgi:hypothetical protein